MKKFIASVLTVCLMLVCFIPFTAFAAEDDFILSSLDTEYAGYDPIPLLVIVVSYDANGNGIDDRAAGISTTNKNLPTYGEQWAYTNESDWAQKIFGDEGKTIKNYYKTMSNGHFWFEPAKETYGGVDNGVVYVTINAQHPKAKGDGDYETRLLALRAASEYVDFSSFDKNGNGYIDFKELTLSFVIAGYNEKWVNSSNGVQVWGINNYQTSNSAANIMVDGVSLCNGSYGGRYIVDGECRNGISQIASIGTIVHELGHVLGANDLYTYSGYTWLGGPGDKALQGTGSNNYREGELSGDSPAAVDPYHLIMYGFERAETVLDGTYTLYSRETEEGYNIIKVNTNNPDLYYLIENRYTEDPDSFDGNIGSRDNNNDGIHDELEYGIIIWRVYQDVMDAYILPNCVAEGEEDIHTEAGLTPEYEGTDKTTVKLRDCDTTIQILDTPGHKMQITVTNAVKLPVKFAFNNNESGTDYLSISGLIMDLNAGDVKSIKATLKTKSSGEVVATADVAFEKDGSFAYTFTGLKPDTTYICEVAVSGTNDYSANTVSINVFTNPEIVEVTDKYTVTFFKNLKDNDKGYKITVKTGEKITYSFPMNKTGYSFCGWYLDEALTQAFDMNFTQDEAKDFNLYAKWVPETEAATLKIVNATATNKIFSVTVGGTFIEPVAAEREGYEFIGWFADEALTVPFDFSAPVDKTGTITVWASWKSLSGDDNTTESNTTTAGSVQTSESTQTPTTPNEPSGGVNVGVIIAIVAVIVIIGAVCVVIFVKKKK